VDQEVQRDIFSVQVDERKRLQISERESDAALSHFPVLYFEKSGRGLGASKQRRKLPARRDFQDSKAAEPETLFRFNTARESNSSGMNSK
jgi:hypothetical protein